MMNDKIGTLCTAIQNTEEKHCFKSTSPWPSSESYTEVSLIDKHNNEGSLTSIETANADEPIQNLKQVEPHQTNTEMAKRKRLPKVPDPKYYF